jgi:4a-hydroxytetrahydrobiopterin dehydratase
MGLAAFLIPVIMPGKAVLKMEARLYVGNLSRATTQPEPQQANGQLEHSLPSQDPKLQCQFVDEGFEMTDLHQMKCVVCQAGEPTVTDSEIYMFDPQIPEWHIKEVDGVKRLERVFKFKNFTQALEFTNKVDALADAEGHHRMMITESRVTINWWTQKIGGLHKSDFIMAAKTDQLR